MRTRILPPLLKMTKYTTQRKCCCSFLGSRVFHAPKTCLAGKGKPGALREAGKEPWHGKAKVQSRSEECHLSLTSCANML